MAKCTKCGKKGLFLKLDKIGLCESCHADQAKRNRLNSVNKDIADAEEKLRSLQNRCNDAELVLAEIKTEIKPKAVAQLEDEYKHLQASYAALQSSVEQETQRRNDLVQMNETAQAELAAMLRRTEKLKPLANSIKKAFKTITSDYPDDEIIDRIGSLDIEDILPQPELNCLTVKQLNSRYKAIRKQIIDVCTAYQSRYTTKTNAALYKLMVLALESELENILYTLRFGKLDAGVDAVRELTAKYYTIAVEGNQTIAPTLKRFIGQIESLYTEAVETEYEYFVQLERAKEEQRAIREQMRQEAEERKRLEQERKQVENEEKKYQQEIRRITEQMQQAHDAELEALRKRLEEVNSLVAKVEEKKIEIINLQNGKAGTVYVISNVGSFGDHVFKIGMTRRLEPQDRVNELGDASVPFPFDVHSFIFSEDAVALETALHKELNDRRVNKVNLRKEFFNISIEELQALVERIDPTAPFRVTALAEQYRQSLSIQNVPMFGSLLLDESEDDDSDE